jgi:hypothetical protein
MREAGAAAFLNKEAAVDELYHTIQAATKSLHTHSVSKPHYSLVGSGVLEKSTATVCGC